MRRNRLWVSVRIDDRFVTAALLGLAIVCIVLLLLRK
jgi:hypothetical protein